MLPDLPKPIADYFAAGTQDAAAIARCFTENAVAIDEKTMYRGRDAIRRWKAEASAKYSYTVVPLTVARENERFVVTSRVIGNFPGSPVDLRYAFVVEGDAIARLEVVP
jgi:hypothetical protein